MLIRSFLIFLYIFTYSTWAESSPAQTLSLEEAIFLAIRQNPNVIQAKLNLVLQKYNSELAKWQFQPHFSLSGKSTTSHNFSITNEGFVTENATGIEGGISFLTPFGTKIQLTPNINQTHHTHPGLSLEVIQPLMRGFGRPIVEAEYYNAMDNEKISHLNVESALRTTVTAVINAYLDVISAENNLRINQEALQRAELSVRQTKLFIKSGRKAGVELVAVEANVANAETSIENDKNYLTQARYALLAAIGIDPNTPMKFSDIEIHSLIKKYDIPTLSQSKIMTIENDIQYQAERLTLHGAKKRSVLLAEDQTRFELTVMGNVSAGNGSGGGDQAGLTSIINGVNQTNMIALNLNIPIDDRQAKTSVANAKIALRQAEIALQQEKWTKETSAINGWNSIFSAKRALHFAENAERLQLKTYQMSFQKYTHGLIDSLQLQTVEQQLIVSGQALNQARLNYLKALVNFDQMIGRTLQTWQVPITYGGEDS